MTGPMSPSAVSGMGLFAARPVAPQPADLIGFSPERSTSSVGFEEMLGRAVDNGIRQIAEAERTSSAALVGNASTVELATAMARAEVALQATIAVRDRVVAAYQEVMRMPV